MSSNIDISSDAPPVAQPTARTALSALSARTPRSGMSTSGRVRVLSDDEPAHAKSEPQSSDAGSTLMGRPVSASERFSHVYRPDLRPEKKIAEEETYTPDYGDRLTARSRFEAVAWDGPLEPQVSEEELAAAAEEHAKAMSVNNFFANAKW